MVIGGGKKLTENVIWRNIVQIMHLAHFYQINSGILKISSLLIYAESAHIPLKYEVKLA